MHIIIDRPRGAIKQLRIDVIKNEPASYRVDDECGILSVKTDQCLIDAASRYLNHGHIWATGFDAPIDLPSILRESA